MKERRIASTFHLCSSETRDVEIKFQHVVVSLATYDHSKILSIDDNRKFSTLFANQLSQLLGIRKTRKESQRWRWRQRVDSHMHPHPRGRIATRCIDLIRMPARKTSIYAVVAVGAASERVSERAVQRAANDFSLRSSRAKCIIYLWSRRLSRECTPRRVGLPEKHPSRAL